MEPKVTGLSPMTGPPGMKITVRGENLGQSSRDVIALTINGADCLPYLEWKSPKKIITRCAKVIGNGDVIVTTNSGGVGTCDVQFNCYEGIVGPTDESAVWVDEIDHQTPVKVASSTFETPPTRFEPQLYLVQNHPNANLMDLQQLKDSLQTKLANKSDLEAVNNDSNRSALLKSNLPVIMECLHILEKLSKGVAMSRDSSLDNIARSINEGLDKTHELFDPLLKQNDMVQSIESAIKVFERKDGTFFDLPKSIEMSIKEKNYDSTVKEISNVNSRLKVVDIEPELRTKIERDVAKRVDILRSTIHHQLHECCRSTKGERNVDQIKKFINHLSMLGGPIDFDIWLAMEQMSDSLIKTISENFKRHHTSSMKEAEQLRLDIASKSVDIDKFLGREDRPPVVEFVLSSINMFEATFHDMLALGQCYFDPKDEFACQEELRHDRLMIYNEIMISKPITHLTQVLKLALISDLNFKVDSDLWNSYDDQKKETYKNWIRYALHKGWLRLIIDSVITCQKHLAQTSLPNHNRAAMEVFDEFVVELRRQTMEILFKNSSLAIKNLHRKEDWQVEIDDELGSVTRLPLLFESIVVDTLKFCKETILSLLKNVAIQGELKALSLTLTNSFHGALDEALNYPGDKPAESKLLLAAEARSTRAPSSLSNRLLITICNYQFTKDKVFPRLISEFKTLLGINAERVFEQSSNNYSKFIDKSMDSFCAIKYNEFRNKDCPDQLYLMLTNSQIFMVAPQLVDNLLSELVNRVIKGH